MSNAHDDKAVLRSVALAVTGLVETHPVWEPFHPGQVAQLQVWKDSVANVSVHEPWRELHRQVTALIALLLVARCVLPSTAKAAHEAQMTLAALDGS